MLVTLTSYLPGKRAACFYYHASLIFRRVKDQTRPDWERCAADDELVFVNVAGAAGRFRLKMLFAGGLERRLSLVLNM